MLGTGNHTNVPIVFTSGGVTAVIGNGPGDLMTNPATALFSSTLTNNGTELLLTTVQKNLGSFATTGNERAVAGSIDPIIAKGSPFQPGFNTLLTELDKLSAGQIAPALESLTPESLQYARQYRV